MPINSRSKGKQGEYQVRDLFRAHGFEARRGQQFQGGTDSPDVVVAGLKEVHLEVKWVQNLNVQKAMEQAIRDSRPGQMPTVFHRKNKTPWLVTVDAEDYFKLLAAFLSHEKTPTQIVPPKVEEVSSGVGG